jgi:PAS domain S-box-containing protein
MSDQLPGVSAPDIEERMRSVVNHVIDGIITIDENGTVTTFNPAAERIFGYLAGEVVTHNVRMLMPEPYHREHDGYISNYKKSGIAKIIGTGREVTGQRKNGTTFPMELAISEFRLAEKRYFTGIVRDITQRKQAETELRQAEQRMRSVVNHVVDGIISIDDRGTVTTFNPAAERIFGYGRSEVVGQNVRMLMPQPYHGEHDGYIRNYVKTGQAKIIGIGREVVGRRKDNTNFPMELAISEFPLGESRHFTGIVRDITERKRAESELRQAEERMRSVVDHVIDGIITIDVRGVVQSFNPAAEKLFGYGKDEVLGRNVKMLMPEPYHGQHDGYISNYTATGQAKIIGTGREVVGKRKNGSTFPMELAVSEFRIGDSRFFTGIVRDITQRKQLEQELRKRVDELADADRQKNEFLAMLGHELRNPLAPMRNAVHLLRLPGADSGMVDQARDMMDRQLQQLVRLVDDLLDVSRIVREKIELRKEMIDVAQALERAVETAQPVLDARGHQLKTLLPLKRLYIEGDLIRLAQIVSNLLTNAAKYTSEAGEIVLAVEAVKDQVVIRVTDPGIGIDPMLLPRIFDLFVQGDHTLARSQGGLGIGLTLVKRLVELHGGTIEAKSEGKGKGSEFILRFPEIPAEATGSATKKAPVTWRRVTRRIIVVDDNVDAAESIAMILRLMGHQVFCVFDGQSVLKAAQNFKPEIVVIDIGLPGMSGYEVARDLRFHEELGPLALVAVTGYGQDNDRSLALAAGFNHMTKPVNPDVLAAFVANLGASEVRAQRL